MLQFNVISLAHSFFFFSQIAVRADNVWTLTHNVQTNVENNWTAARAQEEEKTEEKQLWQ